MSLVFSLASLAAVVFFSDFGAVSPYLGVLNSGFFVFSVQSAILVALHSFGRLYLHAALILLTSNLILVFANWWHYQYFRSFLNYQSFVLIADSLEAGFSILEFKYLESAFLLLLVSSLFLWLSFFTYRGAIVSRSCLLLFFVVAACCALGSGYAANSSISNYRALNVLRLSPEYFNPVHAFFIPLIDVTSLSADEADSILWLSQNNLEHRESQLPRFQSSDHNVVVVMLESIRASELRSWAEGGLLAPSIDDFSERYIKANQFYANTNFTVKAEMATWCGLFDHNAKPPLSKYSDHLLLDCLPEHLKRRGYVTRFYHGYQSRFYNRREFLPKVGFDSGLFYADLDEGAAVEKIGWGISDEAMLGIMLDELSSSSSPFFAHITTLSSHYPFHWQWPAKSQPTDFVESGDKLYDNYRRAVAYEDYAFGKFWEAFKSSPLAENTIVLVTADHGVWTFSPEDMQKNDPVLLDEKFFRVPLMIYHPDIDQPMVIEQVSSQIDIAPTLLAMLGLPYDHFIGKNMLVEVEQPWALMMKSGQLVARIGDTHCRIEGRECAGLHQECVAHQFGELFTRRFSDMQACYQIEGDLLKGGSYKKIEVNEPWLQHGFNLINYHNKRALGVE